jgi:hypothetical protein
MTISNKIQIQNNKRRLWQTRQFCLAINGRRYQYQGCEDNIIMIIWKLILFESAAKPQGCKKLLREKKNDIIQCRKQS